MLIDGKMPSDDPSAILLDPKEKVDQKTDKKFTNEVPINPSPLDAYDSAGITDSLVKQCFEIKLSYVPIGSDRFYDSLYNAYTSYSKVPVFGPREMQAS